ncbi:MAG: hypothetical protein PHC91_08385 [Eubacteriales bacterium]|nr:hypothetical protein [Eubacteriales bacterium]
MKQIIVMISMILLGIAIAGYVNGFSESANTISDTAKGKIVQITSPE